MIRTIGALGILAASLSAGCVAPLDGEGAPGATRQAIKGGQPDADDAAVVYIFWTSLPAECTGSLIAQNLVLTAQHCVAPLANAGMGVDCAVTGFGAPDPPDHFYVATKQIAPTAQADFHPVKEVLVPDGAKLCGGDIALLVLSKSILPDEAVPLVPRVDVAVAEGEIYSAVGFGGTQDDGMGSGQRRRRDGLVVVCAGSGCPGQPAIEAEWMGDQGICEGDSGGPAIDAQGRVIGVTSRGSAGCLSPTYGATPAWADWIKSSALHAAEAGGYDAPAWATGAPTDPAFSAPVGGPCGDPPACAPGTCTSDGEGSYCTRPCSDAAPCPEGFACSAVDGANLCTRPPKPDGGTSTTTGSGGSSGAAPPETGCSAGGPAPSRPALAGMALVLGLLARRRAKAKARGARPA